MYIFVKTEENTHYTVILISGKKMMRQLLFKTKNCCDTLEIVL